VREQGCKFPEGSSAIARFPVERVLVWRGAIVLVNHCRSSATKE